MVALVVVVVILAVVAGAAIAALVVTRRRLAEQEAAAAAAATRLVERDAELATATAALDSAARERVAAGEERAMATERAALATERALASASVAADATERALASASVAADATERAAAAEQRIDDLAAAVGHEHAGDSGAPPASGVDPLVLWRLEQVRSERTWRNSVAVDPDAGPSLADAAEPLREALQIELDAAREEVGVEVDLEAELPAGISAGGSVLALRAAQELLAGIVRQAERATLDVRAEGRDLLVTVSGVDADDAPVLSPPLPLPSSAAVLLVDGGVRIRDAISVTAGGPEPVVP